MLFTPIDASAVVGGGTPRLSTEKDCILTEYLAWHASATFVYNYGLSCTTVQVHANSCIIECPIVFTSERIYSKWYAIVGHSALAQSCLADIIGGSSEQPFLVVLIHPPSTLLAHFMQVAPSFLSILIDTPFSLFHWDSWL